MEPSGQTERCKPALHFGMDNGNNAYNVVSHKATRARYFKRTECFCWEKAISSVQP